MQDYPIDNFYFEDWSSDTPQIHGPGTAKDISAKYREAFNLYITQKLPFNVEFHQGTCPIYGAKGYPHHEGYVWHLKNLAHYARNQHKYRVSRHGYR